MYKQLVKRITENVVLKQTKESIVELIDSKLDNCRLSKKFGFPTAHLLGIKDGPGKYRIVIQARYRSKERLISFAHEVLHILYHVPDFPLTEKQLRNLSEEAHWFLEDTIEELSERTVKAQELFWRDMFQKAFGFPVDTTPIDIK